MPLKLDHVAIVVHNLDQALSVYRDALGLPLARIEEILDEQAKVAFLPFPGGESQLELVQPTAGDTGVARFLANRGEGIHHICLAVDDIKAAMKALTQAGLQLLSDHPRTNGRGQKYVFVHPKTTHGVLLELYENPQQ